ncbi:Uncharacterised protein [uncultured Clostridium sp.]
MLKKPGLEELVRELEKDYARWEQVYMAGSKDPFWPDGVNANLCRNHILCGKRRIRELYPDAEMPEIYYRPLPQELPAEYMARKEELRSAALRSYTRYISDENFCFIRNHVERIPETDALRGILDALLARADVLKNAVLSGDYVAMRRYVPFPVSWTVKMKKKQKETQDILSYHSQAAGCSDKTRAKASGGRQPIEECGRTGL